MPSKRSSIPPTVGSKPKLDARESKETKSEPAASSPPSKSAPPAASTSDRPPASFMTNASPNAVSPRTKTLAGIPLPAMLAYAQENKADSAPPGSKSGALLAGNASPADVDRLKEEPKVLNTLHGVPGSEKT